MRVLLFTLEYPPFKGGVANYYENIVNNWPEPDNISVLDNNKNKLIKNRIWPCWLPAFFALYKNIKINKINHILVGHVLPLGTVAYYITKFIKLEYSVILHGMDFAYALKKPRKKIMAQKILCQAKNIICSNNYTAGLVQEFLGENFADKIQVVNPGISHSPKNITYNSKSDVASCELRVMKLKKKYKLDDKVALFSVGRLVKRKGFDKVIAAMAEAAKSRPNLYYYLAGDGPDKKYLRKLAKNAPNIIFLDKISDSEKWTWLDLCDIFITISRNIQGDFEGFGIVYLEANICGKPVIAGNSGGVPDAVEHNYSGILVNPEDIKAISSAIIGLAENPELRKKLGKQGRKRVLKEFNCKDKTRKVFNLITRNL
ncbi:MAG: glycosyltransferase family 4 protein [Patescibacteria group bacterium]|nr:glycosyltransferase family 4 protein [Patescibacteria group bacterium]